MSGDSLKKRIQAWAKEVGHQRARVELVGAGLGLSTVEKLIHGRYGSTPKGRVFEALSKVLGGDVGRAS